MGRRTVGAAGDEESTMPSSIAVRSGRARGGMPRYVSFHVGIEGNPEQIGGTGRGQGGPSSGERSPRRRVFQCEGRDGLRRFDVRQGRSATSIGISGNVVRGWDGCDRCAQARHGRHGRHDERRGVFRCRCQWSGVGGSAPRDGRGDTRSARIGGHHGGVEIIAETDRNGNSRAPGGEEAQSAVGQIVRRGARLSVRLRLHGDTGDKTGGCGCRRRYVAHGVNGAAASSPWFKAGCYYRHLCPQRDDIGGGERSFHEAPALRRRISPSNTPEIEARARVVGGPAARQATRFRRRWRWRRRFRFQSEKGREEAWEEEEGQEEEAFGRG
mmetsp:Transcript_30171/g.89768  ORF Transcript_30171/g.89768 Transcript_30171/m.89768 type:complete len:327 (+) Transcript_30171:714-1694(+)